VNFLEQTVGLGAEIGGFLALLWPVTLCVGLNLLIAVSVAAAKRRLTSRTSWALLPLALIPIILAWGTAFQYRAGPRGITSWASNALYVFLIADLALAVATTAKLRGNRWLAASLGLASLWISFWAAGVSSMVITGVSL